MSLDQRISDPPDHWPTLDELRQSAVGIDLVLLPDRIDTVDGKVVAAFRLDAQGLRVAATETGLTSLLYHPPGAELVMYTENAADWVLPVLVAAAIALPVNVAGTLVADWIEADLSQHAGAQTMLYREAIDDHGRWKLYEIEGTPHAVVQLLRDRESGEISKAPAAPVPPSP